MMFADLVDETDVVLRLQAIGFEVHAAASVGEAVDAINDQILIVELSQLEQLRQLVNELHANQGLVLPEIIESLPMIQWPQGE
jgi:hypothetical protein